MSVDFNRKTGKAGYVRVIDAANVRVSVPITSWDAEMRTDFDDVTGSMNYSKADGIVYKASAPVYRSLTAQVKGCYHRDSTPPLVIAKLFNGNEPFRVELGYSPLDPLFDFYAWVEGFQTTSPLLAVVTYTCTLRSEGTITDLANLVAGPLNPGLPIDG